MDLGSNSKHMSVSMSASFGENIHADHPGSSSKQLLAGITKAALSTPGNPATNTNNTHNLSGLSSLSHANLFARQADNHLPGQAVTDVITPKKTTTGINNLSSSNNNSNNTTTNNNTPSNTNKINNGENTGSAIISTSNSNGVRYKECLKNHAANMGGYAVDGCGEFMPSGEEGSLEALKCAACGCHRNFHRREINGGSHNTTSNNMSLLALPSTLNTSNTSTSNSEYGEGDHNHVSSIAGSSAAPGAATGFGGHYNSAGHMGTLLPHLHHHHHHQYMHAWMGGKLLAGSGAGHHAGMHVHHGGGGGGHAGGQYPYMGLGPAHMGGGGGTGGGKRFRTKFTMEQREKMFEFSEKVGWRIHKHDEAAVQQFCAETGVKRHVLKVWMHNNKNTFGKKLLRFPEAFNALPESSS